MEFVQSHHLDWLDSDFALLSVEQSAALDIAEQRTPMLPQELLLMWRHERQLIFLTCCLPRSTLAIERTIWSAKILTQSSKVRGVCRV